VTWWEFFEKFSASRRLSASTMQSYRKNLKVFLAFWTEETLVGPHDVESRHLVEFYRAQKNQPGVSHATAGARTRTLLSLLRWAMRQEILLVDPGHDMRIPKPCRPIPRVLTQAEVELLLEAPRTVPRTLIRLRDLALLELLYGTGMRAGEVVALNMGDLDLAERVLRILSGKGQNRRVPYGEMVAEALAAYLDWMRPRFCMTGETALFLSLRGERLTAKALGLQLQRYGLALGIPDVTPHALRRAVATHMLENGASVVEIKELLGHADLNSTMIYTRVFPVELIRSHRKSHPRARRRPQEP